MNWGSHVLKSLFLQDVCVVGEGGWAQDQGNVSLGASCATSCGGCGAVILLQNALSRYRLV